MDDCSQLPKSGCGRKSSEIFNKNLHVNKLFTLKHSLINIHLFFEHILIVILLKTPLKSVLNYVDINSLKNTMQASINKWKKFTSV